MRHANNARAELLERTTRQNAFIILRKDCNYLTHAQDARDVYVKTNRHTHSQPHAAPVANPANKNSTMTVPQVSAS